MFDLVYFSSTSGNTHRFVTKLVDAGFDADTHRLPLRRTDDPLTVVRPFILITPTYGGGADKAAVPKQVIRFLNNPTNRAQIRGVIGTGNTNFGTAYTAAADIIARKTQVPILNRVEIFGTPDDIEQTIAAIRRISASQ